MPETLRPSSYWVDRADETMAKAEAMVTQEARIAMLSMAQGYEYLAERARAREAASATARQARLS